MQVNQRNAIMHFAATPFIHVDDNSIQSDVTLSLSTSRLQGKISVSPQAVADRTNIFNNDEEAAIAVGVSGNGRAQMQLQVGIDAGSASAGRHSTTVVITITAN